MDIQIVLPPHLSIPDHHLCSLVANLLDNAIEASRKIEDPKIVIEMKMVKDYLSLTIRNKMDPSMQDKALTIRTTKADKKQHGLGRQIIDDIVRRYNGISTREIKDGWYIASVMLELGQNDLPRFFAFLFFKRGWYIPSGIHLPPWPLPFLRGSPRQPETVPGAYHLP